MSFVSGLISALSAGEMWNTQSKPPKVYFQNRRVHHYEVGALFFVAGTLLKSPTLAGVGAGLFLHDIDDVQW